MEFHICVGEIVGKVLTDTQARKIGPDSKPLGDGAVIGLRLKPSETKGRGYWELRYTSPTLNKRRDMGLGTYPEVSIAVARKLATEARELIARRIDPLAQKELEASTRRVDTPTFEEAARKYFEHNKGGWKNGKHADQWINTMEHFAFPLIGRRYVNTLKVADFADVLRPIWLSKSETATRVKQRCSKVMEWCIAQDLTPHNPVAQVRHLLPPMDGKRKRVKHQPSLPYKQVPAFVSTILLDGTVGTCREALEFLILTGSRPVEIRKMKWDQVDWKNNTWICPPENMKAKVLHRIPISWRMKQILEGQMRKHPSIVFPSPTGKIYSDATFSKFLRDHRVPSDTPDRTATAHGFRSSLRTWGTERGFSRDVMEKVLAHSEDNLVVAAYERTDQFELRIKVMKEWADFIYGR